MSAEIHGFAVVGPVSPWDEKHRDAIELDGAIQTFAKTAGAAWAIQCRAGQHNIDRQEMTRRTQHWHDRGYRLRRATLTLHPKEGGE